MKKEYSTIAGLGTGRGSFQIGMKHRLYQGGDHLLLVQSTGYTEDYRRVFYRDIRCVVIRRNQRYIWISIVLVAIILLGLVSLLSLHLLLPTLWIPLSVLGLPLALILAVNLLRGPTCDCYVTTNVQMVILPTPQRVDKIPRLLDFLQTKIPALSVESPAP